MTRYRLRFLLQEIDLPQGDTLIGRSAACQVSIEDPLVSRQHARLRIDGELATIENLGSRNGLQVGGRPIQGVHQLMDGDRIRIGTQELVFCIATAPSQPTGTPGTRPTGFMTHCAECDLPFPAELLECPNCGCTARVDEDTLSGVGESQRNWTLQLLVEVLAKARSLERVDDVERIMRRASANIEEYLALGRLLEQDAVDAVAEAAAWLAAVRRDMIWATWMMSVYATLSWVPPRAALELLTGLDRPQLAELGDAPERIVAAVHARSGPDGDELEAFEALEELTRVAGAGA